MGAKSRGLSFASQGVQDFSDSVFDSTSRGLQGLQDFTDSAIAAKARSLQGLQELAESATASKAQNLQELRNLLTKRSVEEEDLELLENIDERDLAEALDIPVSELVKLSHDVEENNKENSETGVATVGESRKKRSLHLLNLHLLGKHFLAKNLIGKAIFGGKAAAATGAAKAGAAKAGAAKVTVARNVADVARSNTVRHVGVPTAVRHVTTDTVRHVTTEPRNVVRALESCRNVNKCFTRPVKKCQETPVESCWEEPREHCPEQRIKVAKKWCHVEEPIQEGEW